MLLFFSLWLLALPFLADLVIWLLILLWGRWSEARVVCFILALCIGVALLSLLAPLVVRQPSTEEGMYREYERYRWANFRFMANIDETYEMPFGDLYAVDVGRNPLRETIKIPRRQHFVSDKHGYRNSLYQLEEADIILVGDSFIAASATTQIYTPANQLSRLTGMKVAGMGFPSEPEHYEKSMIKENLPLMKTDSQVFVFYFEGNDFVVLTPALGLYEELARIFERIEEFKDRVLRHVYAWNNWFFKRIRAQSNVVNKHIWGWEGVTYQKVGAHMVGFHNEYMDVTKAANVTTYIFSDPDVLPRVSAVFFIPTKYRVYARYFDDPPQPSPGLAYLRQEYGKLGIPVVDLTPSIEARSQWMLPKGEYTFWRDDTHWSPHGIYVAMRCIADILRTDGKIKEKSRCER